MALYMAQAEAPGWILHNILIPATRIDATLNDAYRLMWRCTHGIKTRLVPEPVQVELHVIPSLLKGSWMPRSTMAFHPNVDPEQGTSNRRGSRWFGNFGRFGRRQRSFVRSLSDAASTSRERQPSTELSRPPSVTGMSDNEDAISITSASDAGAGYEDDESSVISTDDESNADEEEEVSDFDETTLRNTLFNATSLTDYGKNGAVPLMTNYEDEDLLDPAADEFQTAPNIVFSRTIEPTMHRARELNQLPVSQPGRPKLATTGPVFERNRCTVTMVYGDYAEKAQRSKRPKRYVVASDGSEGSQYAINWAMGTVLRDGDETLIVSVMETDTKLDSLQSQFEDPTRRHALQRVRSDMAILLANQAFVLLQRTVLGVKVSCQAVHAHNAKHMLLDLLDFYSPTMLIVGSRGIEAIRGGVLGSMSHYLVQKSSVPVMVTHNKLQLPRLPRGKADVVNNVRMRHTRLDQAVVEKYNAPNERDMDNEDVDPDAPEGEQLAHKHSDSEQSALARSQREEERMQRLNRKSFERRNNAGISALGKPVAAGPAVPGIARPLDENFYSLAPQPVDASVGSVTDGAARLTTHAPHS